MNRYLIYILIAINLSLHIVYPIVFAYYINSHPLAAMYLMLFTCGQLLKLISFHHVYHDVRNLVRRVKKLGEKALTPEENIFNLP